MVKKCVLYLLLATAYTVLLAHNFTPHHHETAATSHHHHHQDEHGHSHSNDDHEDDNEKNSFYFFQHIGETSIEFTFERFVASESTFSVEATPCSFLQEHFLSHWKKPPLIVLLLRTTAISIQQRTPYFFPLKAPPACTA